MARTSQSVLVSARMEEEVTCVVCSELYTRGEREPVVLPLCGHTFCRPCLCNMENAGRLDCPACRKTYVGPPVDHLPTVFALLSLSEHFRKSEGVSGQGCQAHGSPIEFWCHTCQLPLCGHCLLNEHVAEGHRVVKGTDFVSERREELLTDGASLIQDLGEKKSLCVSQLSEVVARMTAGVEESAVLWQSCQKAKTIMSDAADASSIESVLVSTSMLGSLKEEVTKVSRDVRARRASDRAVKCISCSELDPSCPLGLLRQESSPEAEWQETEFEETEQTTAPDEHVNRSATPPSKEVSASEDKTDGSSSDVADSSSSTGRDSGESPPRTRRQVSTSSVTREHVPPPKYVGLSALVGAAPWPLRCCVVGPGGRRGKLRWEDGRLHMYALGEVIEEAHFMVEISVLQYLIPEDFPEVFLVLESEGRCLGRVYIRLWGGLRRAQHFLALCLGSLGPSYRNSKFHGVAKRGAPGETLAGGKYVTQEGLTSVQALTGHLEWGGDNIREKRKGLVVGANAGRPELDAFFHICTQDQPGRRFACAFGEVLKGMDGLHAAVKHLRESDVTISDVGVVMAASSTV